jgi:hypothetical protein
MASPASARAGPGSAEGRAQAQVEAAIAIDVDGGAGVEPVAAAGAADDDIRRRREQVDHGAGHEGTAEDEHGARLGPGPARAILLRRAQEEIGVAVAVEIASPPAAQKVEGPSAEDGHVGGAGRQVANRARENGPEGDVNLARVGAQGSGRPIRAPRMEDEIALAITRNIHGRGRSRESIREPAGSGRATPEDRGVGRRDREIHHGAREGGLREDDEARAEEQPESLRGHGCASSAEPSAGRGM